MGSIPVRKVTLGLSDISHGETGLRNQPTSEPRSPVGDAVVAIVVQGVVFRALPGDRGLRASTNSTSKNNGLPCLTCDLTQGNDEFWGNCMRKESVSLALWAPVTPANASQTNKRDLSSCLSPEPQDTRSPRSHLSVLRHAPGPTTCKTRRKRKRHSPS